MARTPSKILTPLDEALDLAKQVEAQALLVEREEKKLEKLNDLLDKAKAKANASA